LVSGANVEHAYPSAKRRLVDEQGAVGRERDLSTIDAARVLGREHAQDPVHAQIPKTDSIRGYAREQSVLRIDGELRNERGRTLLDNELRWSGRLRRRGGWTGPRDVRASRKCEDEPNQRSRNAGASARGAVTDAEKVEIRSHWRLRCIVTARFLVLRWIRSQPHVPKGRAGSSRVFSRARGLLHD
jgi:hypothetical protein